MTAKQTAKTARRCRSILLTLISTCLFMTGCWDRIEINDVAIIIATAIDLEDDMYRVTVQLPLPGPIGDVNGGGGGTGGEENHYIDSATGRTLMEAIQTLQARMSRTLFSAHRRVIVVGETLARERGISELFDLIARNPENRLTTYMVISKGPGWQLLQMEPKLERFSGEALRELAKSRGVIPTNLKDIAQSMNMAGKEGIALYVGAKESEKTLSASHELEVIGYAQFREDKMIDYFDDKTSSGLKYLRSDQVEQTITFPWQNSHASVRIEETNIKIRPILQDGELEFRIEGKIEGYLFEDLTDVDMRLQRSMRKLNEETAKQIEQAIRSSIRKVIDNQADSIGFGRILSRKYPRQWEDRYKADWPEPLKNAQFTVSIETEIDRLGRMTNNITDKGEGT